MEREQRVKLAPLVLAQVKVGPKTAAQIVSAVSPEIYDPAGPVGADRRDALCARPVHAALQRLRRAGTITFDRARRMWIFVW